MLRSWLIGRIQRVGAEDSFPTLGVSPVKALPIILSLLSSVHISPEEERQEGRIRRRKTPNPNLEPDLERQCKAVVKGVGLCSNPHSPLPLTSLLPWGHLKCSLQCVAHRMCLINGGCCY